MKWALLALLLLAAPAVAQTGPVMCPDRPASDSSNACASTRWVKTNGSVTTPGGSNGQVQYNNAGAFGGLTNTQLTALLNTFTSLLSGAVPASGGGTTNYLRADGTWAAPPGTATSLAVGSTPVTGGSTTNILYNNAGTLGEYALATVDQVQAGTASKIVPASSVWPAEVTVTYGSTTTFDFSTFRDAKVTLTGNITTQTLTNVIAGKSGTIAFIQDGTGSRTTVWNSVFKFPGGTTPTLTTTASAVDILVYSCRTATFCIANLMNDVK